MPRTPILRFLRGLYDEHRTARRSGLPIDEIHDMRRVALAAEREARDGLSRRGFLVGGGALAAAAMLPWKAGCSSDAGPRVAIIGGGMAGLAAALTLSDAGVACKVYEAQSRVGGRMLSDYGNARGCSGCHIDQGQGGGGGMVWADNQYSDIFGELVDTQHETMIALAERFNVPMVDLLGAQPMGSTDTYFFNGAYYPREKALADFVPVWAELEKDLAAIGEDGVSWEGGTDEGLKLDSMTLYDWIETRVPGGHKSPMGKYLDAAYNIELGAETTAQSALNLIVMLAYQEKPDDFSIFGTSDEGWRIEGGSGRLTDVIGRHLGDEVIQLDWSLQAISRQSDGSVLLNFNRNRSVQADHVLLALPFTVLRTLDYKGAGFDERKAKAILEQGGGHNGKLQLQFNTRYWNTDGPWGKGNGTVFSDIGIQLAWDGTRGLAGQSGILVNYNGGNTTDAMVLNHSYGNTADARKSALADARLFLTQLEQIFPGISKQWNGRATASKCHLDPHYNCAYSFYKPGQYQSICGYERVSQNNIYFAGEHTSIDFLGFMEGAAAEGIAAAEDMLKAMGKTPVKPATTALSAPPSPLARVRAARRMALKKLGREHMLRRVGRR